MTIDHWLLTKITILITTIISINRILNPQKHYFFRKFDFFTLGRLPEIIYIYLAFLGAPVPWNFTH